MDFNDRKPSYEKTFLDIHNSISLSLFHLNNVFTKKVTHVGLKLCIPLSEAGALLGISIDGCNSSEKPFGISIYGCKLTFQPTAFCCVPLQDVRRHCCKFYILLCESCLNLKNCFSYNNK